MSGKVDGNQGGWGVIKRLIPGAQATSPAAPGASEGASAPKVQGDTASFGDAGRRLAAASGGSVAALSPRDLLKASPDVFAAIAKNIEQEFPGLKLSPAQKAEMIKFIADGLAARGFGDEQFKNIQRNLR